jgi:hypothetical protein
MNVEGYVIVYKRFTENWHFEFGLHNGNLWWRWRGRELARALGHEPLHDQKSNRFAKSGRCIE